MPRYIKKSKKKPTKTLNEAQRRNSDIFRLRGFYANACTLPFHKEELEDILACVDVALNRLGAETQTKYMKLSVEF